MTKAAKIITVFNEKGGAGKTTLTCVLANSLGLRGAEVLIADLDPQATAQSWSAAGAATGAFKAAVWTGAAYQGNVIEELRKQITKYDFIVVDCAPSVGQSTTWSALLVTDLALLPSRLSPPDIDALKSAKALARRASEQRKASGDPEGLMCRVVANAAKRHLGDDQAWLKALSQDQEIPVLNETFGDRRAFQQAMLFGSGVHGRGNKEAISEVDALTNQVLRLLKVNGFKAKKGA